MLEHVNIYLHIIIIITGLDYSSFGWFTGQNNSSLSHILPRCGTKVHPLSDTVSVSSSHSKVVFFLLAAPHKRTVGGALPSLTSLDPYWEKKGLLKAVISTYVTSLFQMLIICNMNSHHWNRRKQQNKERWASYGFIKQKGVFSYTLKVKLGLWLQCSHHLFGCSHFTLMVTSAKSVLNRFLSGVSLELCPGIMWQKSNWLLCQKCSLFPQQSFANVK